MLTKDEIAAIRESWLLVAARRKEAGLLFYEILFRKAPEVRPLFHTSPLIQGRKLMDTLAAVVDAADRMETILPVVKELGRSHVGFGARPEHFDVVGAALLETLREICGARFDARSEAAWAKAYGAIAKVMIDAAHQHGARG